MKRFEEMHLRSVAAYVDVFIFSILSLCWKHIFPKNECTEWSLRQLLTVEVDVVQWSPILEFMFCQLLRKWSSLPMHLAVPWFNSHVSIKYPATRLGPCLKRLDCLLILFHWRFWTWQKLHKGDWFYKTVHLGESMGLVCQSFCRSGPHKGSIVQA